MDDRYIHDRTCVYNINYHLIWCTKYRRKVLSEEISNRLSELLTEIGNEKGFSVVEARVGEEDHVHCFVSAPPKLSVTDIVRWLKGISGRHLLMEFPGISEKLWKGHLWNGSYFCETIGSTSEENILAYIERQSSVQR
ncbi:MAG: IS200/IS605 family transposase [Erysipelotrichaceae bacterium]|nr:IS200/IS605 family transposase [Erysipelotrichaceae bacterium]